MLTAVLAAVALGGCLQAEIDENARQLEQQKAELARLQQEVAALNAGSASNAGAPAGSCDAEVSKAATRKGGQKFAAGDFGAALGYYQDALAACPGSAKAELNLARTYEALGRQSDAIVHYRNAAKGGGDSGNVAAQQAREALSRLSGK